MHLHRRPRPVRRARHRGRAEPRLRLRRRDRARRRLPASAGRGGAGRPGLRRVPRPLGRSRLLQHHPARPRRDGHHARPRDARRRRRHLGRRVDVQGQRHRAVLPLRPAHQPRSPHLQALARRRLRRRARWPPRDERVADRARPALPRQRREGLLHRRQHLGGHPRGQDTRAPRRLARVRAADHGRAPLGRHCARSSPRTSPCGSTRAAPSPSTTRRTTTRWPWCWRSTRSAADTASACPTRSRTASSRPSRAASTRRPAWLCSGSPTSASSTRSTTRTPSRRTTTMDAASAGCSTRAAGSTRRR